VKKKEQAGKKAEWTYEYDLFNRLTKVAKDGQVIALYLYDEGGLRIKKSSPKVTVYYIFDTGGNVLYEQENREYMEYIYVLGKHFARVDGNLDNGIGKKYFYHTDHLGSTVLVTDEQGKQVWNAEFTPFGKQVSKEGELDHVTKFTGKDLDEDTGLYYFNARWMDSETGRFITEDLVNDPNNPNLYTYVANNPLKFTDPTGLDLEDFDLFDSSTWFNSHEVQEVFSDQQTEISGLTVGMNYTYEYDSSKTLVSTTLNQTMNYTNGNKMTISTVTLADGTQTQSWTLTTADGKTTTGNIEYDPTAAEQKNLVGIEGFFGINQVFGAIMVATDRNGVIGFFKGSTLPGDGERNILGQYTGNKVIDPGTYRMVSWHHGQPAVVNQETGERTSGNCWNYDNAIQLRTLDGSGVIPTNGADATGVNIHASTNTRRASTACQNIFAGGTSNPTQNTTVSDAEIHEHWPNYAGFQNLMTPHTPNHPAATEQFIGYYYLYRM
jgi:RHS repeat-associated protein